MCAQLKPFVAFVALSALVALPLTSKAQSTALPTLSEAAAAKKDVWGEAAMAQPNGASYEFFEKLLPPPRYVNADFKYYPVVLSAPNTRIKARLISNGSGVNLRGGTRSWNDLGTPVIFRVGPDELRFGEFPDRLEQPTLAQGFLPIPEIRYSHFNQDEKQTYRLDAFVSPEPSLAENAVVFVKFSLAEGTNGLITAQIDARPPIKFAEGKVTNDKGQVLAYFDKSWTWERGSAHAKISQRKQATMAIPTKPLAEGESFSFGSAQAGGTPGETEFTSYDQHRKECVKTWENLLARGMTIEVPEPYVQNAWRHLLIQNFELINGDKMHYSSGNQYDKLYEAEGSDAALAMMIWGYEADARRLIPPLLDFTRKDLEFHQAGHKLDDICRYYWQTRDAEFVKAMRPRWKKEVERIVVSRTNEHGLFPKEQYCGDIATPVYSLNSNAKCWAALRDLVPVLNEIGETAESRSIAKVASEFHRNILAALDQSLGQKVEPPFVPIALLGDEEIHDPITHSRIGGYWNLMANYIIGTRLLSGEREDWLPHYLETHGGLCMGMTRSGATTQTFWTGIPRTNPLYGLRYVLDALRRDDAERALVNFYGMLAHGFTRNTFTGAEGCSLTPLDAGGRIFYCPPNSASNAEWLWVLRCLLVQDWDVDSDGEPDTLRLLFATPRRWLEIGKTIKVERAPTAFGPVSLKAESRLDQGEVAMELELPQRNQPKKILLRARVPEGWKVVAAQAGQQKLETDEWGTVDISPLKGKVSVSFQVKKL
jgi:hypothetical protein